ncbi:MAG: hypothetical protein JSR97_03910 [Verrucomicrobia bacterium]|nr:hypothetical protein [Verrucomicrobiota bacterium]
MATELAELNHHLKIVQIKEAGHGVPYDQPEHFAAATQLFLRSTKEVHHELSPKIFR